MNIKNILKEWWLPIITLIISIILLLIAKIINGWEALGVIIFGLIIFGVGILSIIFIFLKKVFDIEMNWWKYIILIFVLLGLSIIIFRTILIL